MLTKEQVLKMLQGQEIIVSREEIVKRSKDRKTVLAETVVDYPENILTSIALLPKVQAYILHSYRIDVQNEINPNKKVSLFTTDERAELKGAMQASGISAKELIAYAQELARKKASNK